MNPAAPQPALAVQLRAILNHRGVQIATALWIGSYGLVLWLAHGSLPFNRPAVNQLPFAVQLAAPSVTLIEIFALMAVTVLLTRRRVIPDMTARTQGRQTTIKETFWLLSYAMLGQAGGWILGPALGFRPFSFHVAGTVFGCAVAPAPAELWTWALYNFLVFAVVPYLYFRRRYSNQDLNLRSSNRRNDALLILVVLIIESAFELAVFDHTIFGLSARQMWLGASLTFPVFMPPLSARGSVPRIHWMSGSAARLKAMTHSRGRTGSTSPQRGCFGPHSRPDRECHHTHDTPSA
jgi:hypothetical protein